MLYVPINTLTSVSIDDMTQFKKVLIFIICIISGVNNNVITNIGTVVSILIDVYNTNVISGINNDDITLT